MSDTENPDYTTLTVQLLSAYVANNSVPSNELAALIQSTRSALIAETTPAEPETPEHTPAVSIRKSLSSREHVISLIDGRPYKTLKRHLAANGLTPEEYRERFGLPKSYPMVAPGYSEQRRAVAQKIGLGQRGSAAQAAAKSSPSSSAKAQKADDTMTPTATPQPSNRQPRAKSETPVAEVKAATAPARKAKAKPADAATAVPTPKPASASKAAKAEAVKTSRTPPANEKPAAVNKPTKTSRSKTKSVADSTGAVEEPTPAKAARRKLGIRTPKSKPSTSDSTSGAAEH